MLSSLTVPARRIVFLFFFILATQFSAAIHANTRATSYKYEKFHKNLTSTARIFNIFNLNAWGNISALFRDDFPHFDAGFKVNALKIN